MSKPPCVAAFAVVLALPPRDASVLFSFPSSLDALAAGRLAGLAQGISSLANAFAPSAKNVSLVKSEQHRIAIARKENAFWIVLKIRLGSVPAKSMDSSNTNLQYLPSSVCDEAVEVLVERMYERFKLLHNTFRSHMSPLASTSHSISSSIKQKTTASLPMNLEPLQTKMDALFSSYLDTLDLSSLDLTDCINLPKSLTLPPHHHLTTLQTLTTIESLLVSTLPSITPCRETHTFLLHTHTLVTTSPLPPHLLPLYNYLTDPSTGQLCGEGGLVSMVKEKGVGVVRVGKRVKGGGGAPGVQLDVGGRFTGWVVGPEEEEGGGGEDGWGGAKVVYLERGDGMERWRVLVYQYKEDVTLVFL
ncbi:hypothetical protein HDU98_002141, partial [Podochytrium sp. JEL0797]